MTGPIPHEGEADDDVQGWMSEAGDPVAAPRPEHVERLRGMILDRLPPARPARGKSRRLRWLAAAAVLAATALGLLSLPSRQASAWAQVVRAMQEKPWVHVVARYPEGFSDESWINPRNEVVAFTYDHGPTEQGVEYCDLKTNVYFKYVPVEKTIYRLPEPGALKKHTSEHIALMKRLLRGEIAISPTPRAETTGPTVRDVTEVGKPWIAYEWRHKPLTRVQGSVAKTRILVDPATRLPRFWDVESVEGTVRRREFDYPETGPADILAMGVPADAKRVDRVPGDDLDRLLNGLAAGRNRFDDYQGFAWHDGGSNAWRVFRKGRKWRVEHAVEKVMDPKRPPNFPPDVDLAWWRAHEPDYHFELQAVCDGRTIWYYRYRPQSIGPGKNYVPEKPTSVMSHQVYGANDDPQMPWPHLLPEQIGHPQTDGPGAQRTLAVEPKPEDGPPNTIRLSVRDASLEGPNPPDLFRLWVDPERNHLALRAESAVSSGPHSPAARWKVVHIEVNILEDLARSPGGFWYPTRVRRQTPVNEFNKVKYGDTVTRFALDFQAPLPDDLFRPLDLPGVPVE